MFDKLKKVAELNKMRGQAMALKKVLAHEEVTVEEGGVKIVITGEQKFKEVLVNGENNRYLVDALNKAISKSQKLAAKKLQAMGGGMFGLPEM